MRLWGGIKGILYKADLLYSQSLLRVKGQPEHKTLLGGVLSLTIMIFLLAVFYNKIIGTFDKLIINSTLSTSNADDPLPYNISTYDGSNFMFGVEVWHHDLNHGNRYFDIVFTNTVYDYGEPLDSSIKYEMEPCTKQHWSGFPEVQAKFQSLSMSYWKCPPKNMQFQIHGKYSSKVSKTLNIDIKKCTNNSNQSSDFRPCAPQEQINEYFSNNTFSFFTIYFINPLLNPDSQDYLTYYLEDTNYIIFSPDGGAEGQIYIEDYTISTDQSIFPTSQIQVATGGIVTGFALKNQYPTISDTYATFQFFKSASSISINRSFEKLDNVFSYIGGLFGTVLILFFLVNAYNNYLFEVNLAGYLYRCEQNNKKIEKDYNFLYFVGQGIYTFLKFVNLKPNWEKLGQYYKIRQEMVKQLDVLFLIKRINFLQRSLAFLFTDQQLKALHLTSQLTMAQAARIRQRYKLKKRLKNELNKKKSDKSDQSQHHFKETSVKNAEQFINFKLGQSHFNSSNRKPKGEQLVDCDNYSSEKSSSDDEEQTSLLFDLNLLKKDTHSQINKKIWKSIDVRLRNLVEKQRSGSSLEHIIVQDYGQNDFFKQKRSPQIIQMSKLSVEQKLVLQSQQMQQKVSYNQQSQQQIAKKVFSNVIPIRIQSDPTKQGDNIDDNL